MELLINVLLIGMAVAFVTSLFTLLLENRVSSWLIRLIFTGPVSFILAYLLGLLGIHLVVVTLAAGFFSNLLLTIVQRVGTVTISNNYLRR